MKAPSATENLTDKNERDELHPVYEIVACNSEIGSIELAPDKPQDTPGPFEVVIPEIKITEMEFVVHKAESKALQDTPDAEETASGQGLRTLFEETRKQMGSLISGLVFKAKNRMLDKKPK